VSYASDVLTAFMLQLICGPECVRLIDNSKIFHVLSFASIINCDFFLH